MRVTLGDRDWEFRPWSPRMGRVFERTYALDCETAKIDEQRPWLTPPFVIGAACDGRDGYFLAREHAPAFLAAHEGVPVALHNAAFDLAVLHALAPDRDVYRLVDQDRVWDAQILHRLYCLATEGHTAGGRGQSTLERCASLYLGLELPKDVTGAGGEPVRTSYGRWLGRPPGEIEPAYLEYLATDAPATYRVYRALRRRLRAALEAGARSWGFVSAGWLREQKRRWGPATHHIQLRTAIALAEVTRAGLHLDLARRRRALDQLRAVAEEHRQALHEHGFLPGQPGSERALQAILRGLERKYPGRRFPRTPTGKYATNEEALATLAAEEPFVAALLAFRAVKKLRATYLDRMGSRVVHPSFDVLKVTGRTSSFGALNAQNLPRDDRIRSCIVPSPGKVFIAADYAAIEMAALAQAMASQFGEESALAAALNAGRDPHRMVASLATGKPEADVTKEERQKAKPVNFGKPGAMGNETLKAYALASYRVALSDAEVERLSEAWLDQFPEMRSFLARGDDLGLKVAGHMGLTPQSYCEATGSRKFLDHPGASCLPSRPSPALGGMLLKVMREPEPATRAGRPYDAEELEYFWSRAAARLRSLPAGLRAALEARRPSPGLHRAVMRAVDSGPVWTLTGRLRAGASFSARHNNIFQGIAADGAKLALWDAWRAGYRVVNFVHDELLVEVPADSDLGSHAEAIRGLMIAAMRRVIPDVRVEVEYAASTAWAKSALRVTDEAGRLAPWSPEEW